MIAPVPELPQEWRRYPVTLALVAANVFIFLMFFAGQPLPSSTEMVSDRDLRTAGRLYLLEASKDWRPEWLEDRGTVAPARLEMYGSMAIRDRRFLQALADGAFKDVAGDAVALTSLTTAAAKFSSTIEDRALHRFGLSSGRSSGFAWLTYQFAHANLIHLLSNLVFLLLLGFALETRVGGGTLLALYIGGGLAGGWAYLMCDPNGVIPMVGASGAVSALIAAYPAVERKRRIRYYYFVLPILGQHGFIHLPTLLIVPLFLMADVAALMAHPSGLTSGVAYAAHVGGAAFGVVVGLLCRVLRRPPVAVSVATQSEL